MKKRKALRVALHCILAAAVFGAGIFALTACGPVQAPGTGEENTPQTIRLCVDTKVIDHNLAPLLAEFLAWNKEYELDIQVLPDGPGEETAREAEVTSLRLELASGLGPDLLIASTSLLVGSEPVFPDANKAVQNGYLADLQPLVAQYGIQADDFLAPLLAAGQYEGAQVFWPLGYSLRGYFFEGADYARWQASEDQTTAGLLAFIEEMYLASSEPQPRGETAVPLFHFGANPMHTEMGQMLNYETRQVTLDTPYIRELLAYGERLHQPGAENLTSQLSSAQDYDGLKQGYDMFYPTLINFFDYMWQWPEDLYTDPAFVPLPSQDGGLCAQINYYAAMPTGCANPEGGAALLAFLLEEKQQQAFGYSITPGSALSGFPTRKNCLAHIARGKRHETALPQTLIQSLLAAKENITTAVISGHTPARMWYAHVLRYWNGETTLDECLREAEKQLSLYMAE